MQTLRVSKIAKTHTITINPRYVDCKFRLLIGKFSAHWAHLQGFFACKTLQYVVIAVCIEACLLLAGG